MQVGNSEKLVMLKTIPCVSVSYAQKLEKYLHHIHAADRISGEWFKSRVLNALLCLDLPDESALVKYLRVNGVSKAPKSYALNPWGEVQRSNLDSKPKKAPKTVLFYDDYSHSYKYMRVK